VEVDIGGVQVVSSDMFGIRFFNLGLYVFNCGLLNDTVINSG
jgi:hypothetical protein